MANSFALMCLLGWLPVSVALCVWLPIARAVSVSVVAGWLILPCASYELPGLPDYGKVTAIFLATLVGVCLHKDFGRLLGEFRITWIDIPAIALCIGVIVTSIVNDLGIWDGISSALQKACLWTGPYFLGRIIYRSMDDLTELALAILVGGLCYVPLCLFEVRMSPQIHDFVYGFAPRRWAGTRYGGYRPIVFLESGLELGMWMSASSLVGIGLWQHGIPKRIWGTPISILVLLLLITTVLCKATGALILLAVALIALFAFTRLGTRLPLVVLFLVAPVYIGARASGLWNAAELTELTGTYFPADRAQSLSFRIENELMLAAKARQRAIFGWGGWGRSRVYDDFDTNISIADSLWIQFFGQYGVVGLLSIYGMFSMILLRRLDLKTSQDSLFITLSLLLAIYCIDTLLNAMENPVYSLMLGGLVGQPATLERRSSDRNVRSYFQKWPRPARRLWPIRKNSP